MIKHSETALVDLATEIHSAVFILLHISDPFTGRFILINSIYGSLPIQYLFFSIHSRDPFSVCPHILTT